MSQALSHRRVRSPLASVLLASVMLFFAACDSRDSGIEAPQPKPSSKVKPNNGFQKLPPGESPNSNNIGNDPPPTIPEPTANPVLPLPPAQVINNQPILPVMPGMMPGVFPGMQPPGMPSPENLNQLVNSQQVFEQGASQWCWAYSAFHTLRGYYLASSGNDPTTSAWRNAINRLNTAEAFRSYMSSNSSAGNAGDPIQFVQMMQSSFGLPAQNWGDNYANGGSGGGASNLLTQLDANLRRGIPSVWCDSGHCVSVQAVTGTAGSAQYTIFDSASGGSGKYQRSASELINEMDLVMLLR